MSAIKFTPKEMARELQRHVKRAPEVFRRAALVSAQRARTALVKATPTDQGVMRNAWKVLEQTAIGVHNDAPYAGIIELGARPHKVSKEGVQALTEWVIRKGLATYEVGPAKGKQGPAQQKRITKSKQFNANDDAAAAVNAIVWGIVRRLATEGQKGLYIARDVAPLAAQWLGDEFVNQLTLDANKRGS